MGRGWALSVGPHTAHSSCIRKRAFEYSFSFSSLPTYFLFKKNVLFIVSVFESRVEYENRGETKKQASQGQRTVFIFSAVCYTYVGKRKEKNRF